MGGPLSSMQAARKWAASSVPALIVFAILLHLLFSAILVTKLHDTHNVLRTSASKQVTEIGPIVWSVKTEKDDGTKNPGPSIVIAENGEYILQMPGAGIQYPHPGMSSTPTLSSLANPDTIANPDIPSVATPDTVDLEAFRKFFTIKPTRGRKVMPLEMDEFYKEHLLEITEALKAQLNANYVVSCRWQNSSNNNVADLEDCSYHLTKPSTFGYQHENTKGYFVLFNSLDHDRILCDGSRIGPAGIRVLDHPDDLSCWDPPRLFPEVPTLTTKKQMDPITVRFRSSNFEVSDFECDVPCRSDDRPAVLSTRRVDGTPWRMTFSMEGPFYYKTVRYTKTAHRHNEFYSTTSFDSEVPLPYFSFEDYGDKIQAPAVNYTDAIKGAVFIARNCQSRNRREALAKSLIQSDFRVDSISRCLHNYDVPDDQFDKVDIMKHYLFHLAFENQCEGDYITEKLWQALASGTLPVYYGAPNVAEHAPPHSVINANDFETTQDLIDYLNKVANNQTLYESYHAWRTKPLPESFYKKYNFTKVHSTCRTCRWAFSKKYGLTWDHESQTVSDLKIPRRICHDGQGLLTHPFQEAWLSGDISRPISVVTNAGKGSLPSCGERSTTLNTRIKVGNHALVRTVRSHDGVTDIQLDNDESSKATYDHTEEIESIILQMNTLISADEKSEPLEMLSERHYRFQDATKRMTLLANRDVAISHTATGILEVRISLINVPLQLRIIVEDIDTFYEDGEDRTNYFGQMMTEDFLNPLEAFVVFGNPTNISYWNKETLESIELISAEKDDEELILEEIEKEREQFRFKAAALRLKWIQIKDKFTAAAESFVAKGVQTLIDAGIIERIPPGEDDYLFQS